MRKVVPALSAVVLIVLTMVTASAQAPAAGQGRGQAAAAPARPVGVDAATAKKMVAAAEAAALALNAPMAIAVVDGNGDLVYFERMDGASARAVTSSQGKARAALLLGVPTKEAQDAIAAGKPIPVTLTNPPAGAWEITIGQGGLPILKDGKVVAAMGCGGSLPANDEKVCQAGIDAMKN
jgi:glc operon protein GlcG